VQARSLEQIVAQFWHARGSNDVTIPSSSAVTERRSSSGSRPPGIDRQGRAGDEPALIAHDV